MNLNSQGGCRWDSVTHGDVWPVTVSVLFVGWPGGGADYGGAPRLSDSQGCVAAKF